MSNVYTKIQELEEVASFSKHEQLVNGIINAIDEKVLEQGNMLPSVNKMVDELGFARKTIVKAYDELKDRGIVESKKRLGYFIVNEATDQTVKVALLLYAFHTFQEIFYNTFRESLGAQIQLDIYFHHNNPTVFETIFKNIKGQYGMYVVAPIHHKKTRKLLSKLPAQRLLLVDRYEDIGPEYSYLSQEFENSTYQILEQLTDAFQHFEELILFFQEGKDYPEGTKLAFIKFLSDYQISGKIVDKYRQGTVQKGLAYITIGDIDLWSLLKDCAEQNLELGKDVGILSSNDSPVKEIISGGITTYFADFKGMAKKAAKYVLTRESVQEIMPIQLERRKSL